MQKERQQQLENELAQEKLHSLEVCVCVCVCCESVCVCVCVVRVCVCVYRRHKMWRTLTRHWKNLDKNST